MARGEVLGVKHLNHIPTDQVQRVTRTQRDGARGLGYSNISLIRLQIDNPALNALDENSAWKYRYRKAFVLI